MSPVSIAHPSAPAQPAASERVPKYLVRKDGVVLLYHPVLARLGTFEPADALPEWHLCQVEAAARREAERQEILKTRQDALDGKYVAAELEGGRPASVPRTAEAVVVARRRARAGAR
jgi:hypothetical protein